MKKIVKNLHADVKNVKVAVVHRTNDNWVLKAGVEIESITVNPPLDQDIENLMTYTKLVEIKGFNLYVDTLKIGDPWTWAKLSKESRETEKEYSEREK